MNDLFSRVCEILFTFDDGSTTLCTATLNEAILAERGFESVNGFVDLSSGKIIPEDLFDNPFTILPQNTKAKQTRLDEIFNSGGKVHWSPAIS